MERPRKAWGAGLLSFLAIGLGHVYSGEAKKGILFYFGQAIILAIFLSIILIEYNVTILLTFILISIAYFIYVLIDAVKVAKKKAASYSLKKYNKWYVYLAYFIAATFIIEPVASTLIKNNIVEAFKIPAGSMIPTLEIGDHFLVDKYIYKTHEPERGDVVVFVPPHEPEKRYVKRLIGIGGDTIEIKNKELIVNGILQTEGYIIHSDKKILPSDLSPRDNFGPVTVPNNQLFFLGDNRDNSLDSRFWGFASADSVVGKAMSVYFSWDGEEMRVRWDKIGKKLEELTN